jgi:hypothetical protein
MLSYRTMLCSGVQERRPLCAVSRTLGLLAAALAYCTYTSGVNRSETRLDPMKLKLKLSSSIPFSGLPLQRRCTRS